METITLSPEMLHEVLCTQLHGMVPNAWSVAEELVEAIKTGAQIEQGENSSLSQDADVVSFDEADIYKEDDDL